METLIGKYLMLGRDFSFVCAESQQSNYLCEATNGEENPHGPIERIYWCSTDNRKDFILDTEGVDGASAPCRRTNGGTANAHRVINRPLQSSGRSLMVGAPQFEAEAALGAVAPLGCPPSPLPSGTTCIDLPAWPHGLIVFFVFILTETMNVQLIRTSRPI
jgi:hypothetical protein